MRRLSASQRMALREDVAELAMLLARAEVALAARGGAGQAARRKALGGAVAWLDLAERDDPRPSAALFEDRARFEEALGQAGPAAKDRARAERTPPSSRATSTWRGPRCWPGARPTAPR